MEILVYLDFGGSLDFSLPKPGSAPKPLVMAAVAFPAQEAPQLLATLPRGSDGSPMKSSSREFYPPIPEHFIQALLATNACIGGVIANASDPANVAKSQEWHANEASARDQARRLGTPKLGGAPPRRIGERHLNYIRLVIQTLVQVVEAIGIQHGVPKRLTVIADRENIGKHSQDLSTAFESAMQAVGATGSLRWKALQDDHLLYLPDLVAGIITRHFNHDDALEAASLLWREAQRSQRVKFANKVPQAPA